MLTDGCDACRPSAFPRSFAVPSPQKTETGEHRPKFATPSFHSFMILRPSSPPLPSVCRSVSLMTVAVVLLVTTLGCGGSNKLASPNVSSIAERALPGTRFVGAHPDSLQRLSIVEEENRVRFDITGSYQRMHEAWSSKFQFATARRTPSRPLTYATLWSKELSLTALEAEERVSTLPKEKALPRIDQAREEYQKTLQIDVYWFTGPDGTSIAGPGAQVRLHDGEGNSYRPARERDSPLRDAFILNRSSVLYRRNFFFFQRTQDGRDILEGIDELRLTVSPIGGPTVEFRWSWEER